MGKTCLKLFLTGIISFIIGIAGLAALAINGYDLDDISVTLPVKSADSWETTFVVTETAVVDSVTAEDSFFNFPSDAAETVNKLSINVKAGSFTVMNGDSFSVSGTDVNPDNITCSISDGCLYVSYTPDIKLFDFSGDSFGGDVFITVPSKLLESVDLTVTAGDLYMSDINTKTFSLDISAGNTCLGFVTVQDRAKIKMTAGSCSFDSCNFINNSDIKMTAGDMVFDNCKLTGDSSVQMSAGELNMNLIGSRSDYNITVDKTAGEVYIDGDDAGVQGVTEIKNNMNIKITAGQCNISFFDE